MEPLSSALIALLALTIGGATYVIQKMNQRLLEMEGIYLFLLPLYLDQ